MSSLLANLIKRAVRLDSGAADLTSMDSCVETRYVWRMQQRGLVAFTPSAPNTLGAPNLAVQAVLIGEEKGGSISKLNRFSLYAHQYFTQFRKPPMTPRIQNKREAKPLVERNLREVARGVAPGVEGDRASFPGLVPIQYSTLDPNWGMAPCRHKHKRWRLSTVSLRPAPPPPPPPRAFSLFTTPPLDLAPVMTHAKTVGEPEQEKTLRGTVQTIYSNIQTAVLGIFIRRKSLSSPRTEV